MGFGPGAVCGIHLNSTLTAAEQARYQDTAVIQRLLGESRTVAIVGLSADRQKASSFVASYLRSEGYRIVPVNPRGGEILGETVYPDLESVPISIDIVDVFRPPTEALRIAEQAVSIKARALWLQLRIVDIAAAEHALAAGLSVVVDKCIKMEHGRFRGGLHAAGMNTEIVTAKRPRLR
ncbi:MAG: CoA-binding protein [Polyangiaceae bacterium]|jgi:predicted CoA-binding protein